MPPDEYKCVVLLTTLRELNLQILKRRNIPEYLLYIYMCYMHRIFLIQRNAVHPLSVHGVHPVFYNYK